MMSLAVTPPPGESTVIMTALTSLSAAACCSCFTVRETMLPLEKMLAGISRMTPSTDMTAIFSLPEPRSDGEEDDHEDQAEDAEAGQDEKCDGAPRTPLLGRLLLGVGGRGLGGSGERR